MLEAKKVKVDTNPIKVQNPLEQFKRSPGKFDQKVYLEQENFASQALKEREKVYDLEKHVVSASFEKEVDLLRKRKAKLTSENTNYGYLKQLRQALNDEQKRRNEIKQKVAAFNRHSEEKMEEQVVQEAVTVEKAEDTKNYRPWENVKPKHVLPENKHDEKTANDPHTGNQLSYSQGHPANKITSNQVGLTNQPALPPIELKCLIAPSDKVLLEKLSKEIMTGTLPTQRMRRLIPEEKESISKMYPIMSQYRKMSIIPGVKKFKRQLSEDTAHLHTKIHSYFGTKVPLSTYTIPSSAVPRKVKLLKAISHEEFPLPNIGPDL